MDGFCGNCFVSLKNAMKWILFCELPFKECCEINKTNGFFCISCFCDLEKSHGIKKIKISLFL